MVNRGEVWLVLPESAGGGPAEPHPCVILSPPEIHDHLGLVTVAPFTLAGKPAGYRVPLEIDAQRGMIRLEQIRTINKRALTRQVGTVDRKTLSAALATLRDMFAD
ncbi:MAG: type II toxin-antitoxin system PemK/MazF family toxin [Hyphomicrobiales bacterium]|nr:type II toxin-antitoxin system PemK/MazF family toxin [Alphaproteobacteria bacterium]